MLMVEKKRMSFHSLSVHLKKTRRKRDCEENIKEKRELDRRKRRRKVKTKILKTEIIGYQS